jgi:hypothetical protein
MGGGALGGSTTDSSNSSLAAAAGATAPASDHHLLYAPYHSSKVDQPPAGGQWTDFGHPAGSEAEQYQLQQQQQHDVMHSAATYQGYQMLPHDHHQQPDMAHLGTDQCLPGIAAGFTSQLLNPNHIAAAGWQQQQQRSGGSSKRSSKSSKTTNPDGTPKPKGRSGPKSKFSPFIGVSQYKRTGRWEVGSAVGRFILCRSQFLAAWLRVAEFISITCEPRQGRVG